MFKLGLLIFVLSFINQVTSNVHFTDDNLITDVCSLTFYKGKYHMFYQYFTLDKQERDITFFTKVVWGHRYILIFNN